MDYFAQIRSHLVALTMPDSSLALQCDSLLDSSPSQICLPYYHLPLEGSRTESRYRLRSSDSDSEMDMTLGASGG